MSGLQYPGAHLPLLGKGSLLFDRFDAAGAPQGFLHLGNCTSFSIASEDERAELYGSVNKSSALIASALKQRKMTLKITGTDFGAERLAIVLMGQKSTYTQTATAVTGEALASATVTKKGKYFQTAKRNIASVTVKQGTALVAGTDYVVADSQEGLIYFPASGAVNDATAVTVDYTPGAITALDQVAGGTSALVAGRLKFVPDPADGQKITVDVWKVNLSPDGELGLISDDYGNWSLSGQILDDTANHPAAPFYLATFQP